MEVARYSANVQIGLRPVQRCKGLKVGSALRAVLLLLVGSALRADLAASLYPPPPSADTGATASPTFRFPLSLPFHAFASQAGRDCVASVRWQEVKSNPFTELLPETLEPPRGQK